MADEEEVQDTQEEHLGLWGPPNGRLVGSARAPDSHFLLQDSSTLKPTMAPAI